jgi:hypothetical protein
VERPKTNLQPAFATTFAKAMVVKESYGRRSLQQINDL